MVARVFKGTCVMLTVLRVVQLKNHRLQKCKNCLVVYKSYDNTVRIALAGCTSLPSLHTERSDEPLPYISGMMSEEQPTNVRR